MSYLALFRACTLPVTLGDIQVKQRHCLPRRTSSWQDPHCDSLFIFLPLLYHYFSLLFMIGICLGISHFQQAQVRAYPIPVTLGHSSAFTAFFKRTLWYPTHHLDCQLSQLFPRVLWDGRVVPLASIFNYSTLLFYYCLIIVVCPHAPQTSRRLGPHLCV